MNLYKNGVSMKTARIGIRTTEHKKQRFMKAAQQYGVPLSQLIESIMDEWCSDHLPIEWQLDHAGLSAEDKNKLLQYLREVENE